MSLDSLPFELICLVASFLPSNKDISSLLRSNRMIHDSVIYVLYKQDRNTYNWALRCLLKGGFERGIQHIISCNNLDLNIPVDPCHTLINTPLLLAVGYGRTNIVELLLRNGAQVNLGTEISALGYAATLGDYNMTSFLLQNGAHVEVGDAVRGVTPLGCALECGYAYRPRKSCESGPPIWADMWKYKGEDELLSVIELLLAHGADLLCKSGSLSTCLHMIPMRPWESIEKLFRLCLDFGADLNAQNWEGDTPLHRAYGGNAFSGAIKFQKEFVGFLLTSGADVNIRNMRRETPLGAKFENPGIFGLVFKPGSSTRYCGRNGDKIISRLLRTPLRDQKKDAKQYLINTILIELLLERGAYADQIIDGKCPLDLPAARKYPALRNLMSKREMAPRKAPPKKSYRALKDSGSTRKVTKYKKSTKPTMPTMPTRTQPPRKSTQHDKFMGKLRPRIPRQA